MSHHYLPMSVQSPRTVCSAHYALDLSGEPENSLRGYSSSGGIEPGIIDDATGPRYSRAVSRVDR